MASAFNLTAQINLRGPANARQIAANIRKQLGSISANVNVNINPKSVKTVAQLNKSLTTLNSTLSQITPSINRVSSAVNKLQSSTGKINTAQVNTQINSLNSSSKGLITTLPQVNRQFAATSDNIKNFGRQAGLAVRRFSAFAATTSVIYGVSNAVSRSLQEFIAYDKQIVRLSQVTGSTKEELSGFGETITQLSTSLGASSLELSQISVTLAQAGLQAREAEQALKALALTTLAPSFSNVNQTVEGSIALLKQFELGTNQLEAALGSINSVAANFAVEAGDIIKAIQRTGGVFATASKGVSEGIGALQEFIAVFTSVRATTRESAETIATGLRTIFTRIQRGSTIEAMKEFGVTLTDVEGKFVGAYKAIGLLAEGLRNIDPRDVRFSQIVEELGGFRQIGKVIPLIQQFTTAQDALNVAQAGTGSLSADAAKGQLALAVQIQKVREEFNGFIRSVGQSTAFKNLVTVGLDLASALIKIADATKGLLPLIGIFAAFRGIRAATQFSGGLAEGLTGKGKANGGFIRKYAKGGVVPGTGNTDSVPAMLQPGEFVIRKKAVQTLGTQRLHNMNKFGDGGMQRTPAESATTLPSEGSTEFTHLSLSKVAQTPKGENVRLYNNMGLDLPKTWNRNWGLADGRVVDNWGAYASDLADYIRTNDVFKTLKSGKSKYRFVDRKKDVKGQPQDILRSKADSIRGTLATLVATQGGSFLDNDFQVGRILPRLVRQAISSTEGMTQKDSRSLKSGMRQTSAMKPEGKSRKKTSKSFRQEMGLYAQGGSVDTVPAMLTPGEFVINKSSASRIGGSTLNKLNNADRIKGYNKGGWVGFASGGGVSANPALSGLGDAQALNLLSISSSTNTVLNSVGETLEKLGITASNSSRTLEDARDASATSAQRALEADYELARAGGASADVLLALRGEIDKNATSQQEELQIRRAIQEQDIGGEQIQAMLNEVEKSFASTMDNIKSQLMASGMSEDDANTEVANRATGERARLLGDAASAEGLDLSGVPGKADHLERTINSLMRDTDVLVEMNAKYRQDRRQELMAAGENAAEIDRIIDKEITARKNSVNDQANAEGVRGPKDNRNRMSGLMLGGMVIGAGSAVSNFLDPKASAVQAGAQAGIQGGTQTLGIGIGIVSELNQLQDSLQDVSGKLGVAARVGAKFAKGLALAGTGLFTIYTVTQSVFNAMQEFEENLLTDKIKMGVDAVSDEFDRFKDDLDKIDIAKLNAALVSATQSFERSINDIALKGRITFTNFFEYIQTLIGMVSEEEFGKISEIERLGGKGAAVRARQDDLNLGVEFGRIIPQLAAEQAAAARVLSDSILQTLELRLKRGETAEDITSGLDFDAFAETIAAADTATRQWILNLENSGLNQATINRRRQEIITAYAEEQVRLKELQIAREKELQSAIRFAKVFTSSLERSLNNFNQAVNATALFLDGLDRSVQLVTQAYKGQSKVLKTTIEAITILENPQAFSSQETGNAASQAAGFFSGSPILGNSIQPLLESGSAIEDSIMSTINDVLSNNASSSNELIEAKISTNVIAALKGLGLPPELVQNLGSQVSRAISKLRGTPGSSDQISFSELQDEVAGLAQTLGFAKSVQGAAVSALQTFNKALNSYENNVNNIIDAQLSSNNKLRTAENILIDASTALAKTLGKNTDLEQTRQRLQSRVSKFNTEETTPRGLFNEIKRLGDVVVRNDSVRQGAAARGPEGVDDFQEFTNNIKNSSIALRENYQALEFLSENTDMASEAMNAIQNQQRRIGGRVSFIEKLVTSSPDELLQLNQAFSRLQNNINGQTNNINNSVGAQKAYKEALLNGANAFGAMKAAQTAFAQERKSTLGLLQDLLPFLGEGQEASGIRANVLESMLVESGIGINPLLQKVLNSLRNPENDPVLAAAVSFYNEAISLQAEANKYLARLDGELATDIATKNAVAIAGALKDIELRFVNQELKDLAAGINQILSLGGGGQAGAFAQGGIIYASTGKEIFKPKGSDTVPAMLTPGEFVVNRQATQQNRGMLESINSGKVSYYDRGGMVHSFGDTEQITKSNRVSFNKIIDLEAVGDTLLREATAGELYASPQAYTQVKPPAAMSPPPGANPPSSDFGKDLDPGANTTVLPGISQGFIRNPATGNINYIQDQNFKTGMRDMVPVKDQNSFIHLNSEAMPEKRIRELDFEAYKNKANSHIFDLPEWTYDGITFGATPPINDIKALQGKDSYSPAKIATSRGLVKNSKGETYESNFTPLNAPGHRYEIFDGDNGKDVVSKGPPAYPLGHPYAGVTWTKRPSSPEWNRVLKEDLSDDKFIKHENFQGLVGNQNLAWQAYERTRDFLNAPTFKDGDTPPEVIDLQAKLKQIYDGAFVRDFMPPILAKHFDKIKDITGIDNPRSLLVFNNLPNTTTALDDAIKYYEANPEQADRDNVAFTGRNLRQGSDFVKDKDLKIYGMDDTGNIDPNFPVRNFPALVNGNLDIFDDATKTKIMEELSAQHPGGITMDDLPIDELEIPIPGVFKRQLQRMLGGAPIPKMKMKIAYQKWKGKFFNPDTDKFEGLEQELFLPNKVGKTLFSELDTDMKRLVKGPAGEKFKAPDISQAVKGAAVGLGLNNAGINKFLEGAIAGDYSDPAAAQAKGKIKDTLIANLGQSYFKNAANTHFGLDTLVKDPMGGAVDVNMGGHFIEAIEQVLAGLAAAGDGIGDKALDEKRAGVADGDLPRVIQATISGAIDTLGGVNLPGLNSGWLTSNIGALPMLLGNRPDMAIGAALKSGNVLGNLAGYLTKIGNSANSPQAYQFMKEAYTLAAGASSVLTGLGSGNTNFIAQIMDAGLNTNWNTLFRSAGASFLTDRLLSNDLPGDLKNLLEDELDGGTIKRVGANGSLTETPMIGAIPTDWKGFSDLVLNPYNEFPETDTRANLIEKLGKGLINSVGPFGLPYFDDNTSQFIFDRLSALYDWYGGNAAVNWPGQDSLFDEVAQPDPQKRATDFFGSIAANPQFYTGSNQAHIELGLGAKYGPLPKKGYFQGRAAQGLQTGGVVYAQDGGEGQMVNFRPQGTDTVPAMLTPGEFVINRSAAQKNLPLLQSINNGSKGYSSGGVIYAADGAHIGGEYFEDFQQFKASRPKSADRRGLAATWSNALRQAEIDKVNEFYKIIGPAYLETESLLTGQYGDSPFGKEPGLEGLLGEAMQAGDMEKAQKIGKAIQLTQSVLPALKASRDHTYFLAGKDGKYGTMDDGDSPLGDLSTALTTLGLVPGIGNVADLASVLVDLARGDKVGAGLGMTAALPIFGYTAGAMKLGKKALGFGYDGVKIAKKLTGTANGRVAKDVTQELSRRVTLRQTSKIGTERDAANALMLKLNDGQGRALTTRVADGGMPIEEYTDIKRAMFNSNLSGLEPEWDKLKPLMYPGDESVKTLTKVPGKFKAAVGISATVAAALGSVYLYMRSLQNKKADEEKVVEPPGGDLMKFYGAPGAVPNSVTGEIENIPARKGDVTFEGGDANRPLPVLPGDVVDFSMAGDPDQDALNDRIKNGLKQYKKELPGDNYLSELEKRSRKADFIGTQKDIGTIEQNLKMNGVVPAFARGGMVYADQGMLIPYMPQGTDTVPAMLTPGEFVINRQATQANLPLLKAINSGAMSTGGVVYAQDGKEITDKDRFFTQLADKQSLPTTHSMSSMESTNTASPRSGEAFNNEAVLKELDKMSAFVSTLLGIGGMIPYAGEPLDFLASGIDALRGDYVSSTLGLASMAPLAGSVPGATNIARKLSNLVGDTVPDLIAAATKRRDEALITINSLVNKTEIPGKGGRAFKDLQRKNRRGLLKNELSGQEMNLKKAEMIAESVTPPKTLDEFLDKSEKGVTASFENFGTRAQTKAYLEELGTSPDRLFLDGQGLDISRQGGLGNLYMSGRSHAGTGPLRPGEFDKQMLPRFDKIATDNTENALKIKQAQEELTNANKNIKTLEAMSIGIEPKVIQEAIPVPKGPPPFNPMTADEAWKNTQRAQGKSTGGMVYASNGMLIPGSVVNYLAPGGRATGPTSDMRNSRTVTRPGDVTRFSGEDARRLSNRIKTPRLSSYQLDPVTGVIRYPEILQDARFSSIREQLDSLFMEAINPNREIDPIINNYPDFRDAVFNTIDKLSSTLKNNILDFPSTDYGRSQIFLKSLKSEVGFSDNFNLNPVRSAAHEEMPDENRQQFSRGGVVYADQGMLIPYQPKGTDTVPAMLTPGEFVINRKATQQNLGLLKSINSGSDVSYLAAGGGVQSLEEQREERRKQFEVKKFLLQTGLADPFGSQAVKEIVTAPSTFDLLNTNAIREDVGFLNEKWTEITNAVDALSSDDEKQEYLLNKAAKMNQRAEYLTKIGTNSQKLFNRNGEKLNRQIPATIDPSNNSQGELISDILETQFQHAAFEFQSLTDLSDSLKDEYPQFDPTQGGGQGFARGGMVYASNGLLVPYRPQGTDTVPAMLTPGEFVVNKSATDKNLPALQQMNRGGKVSYLAGGTPGTDALKESVTKLTTIFDSSAANIQQSMNKIARILTQFAQNIPVLTGNNNNGVSNNNDTNPMVTIEALGNKLDLFVTQIAEAIPDKIVVEGNHNVNVVINGAQALQQLLSGPLAEIVRSQVEAGFASRDREREGS